MKRPPRLEKHEQADGVTLLKSLGATVYVLGTRRARGDYPGTRQTPGLPDVLAFVPRRGTGALVFVAWECKARGGRVRAEQRTFADCCRAAGVAQVTGDLTALMHWLVAEGFLRADQLPASRQQTLQQGATT